MEIPAYPMARPLEMADRPVLTEIFQQLQPEVSELSFANLYLFRRAHVYTLAMVGGSLVIFGRGYGGEPYFLPPVSGHRGETAARLLADGKTLYGADERFISEHLDLPGLTISEDRDNFDYLYLKKELALLPGRKYHKKKNRINYFVSRHNHRVETFKPEKHLAGSTELLEEWTKVHAPAKGSALELETEATGEALELTGPLGLEGVVIVMDKKVAAFALGERLNRDTAVCHFEKSDPFMEGLAQLVNREFSNRLFGECTLLNREQDLGEPGLRSAKNSYYPFRLVKKFRVTAP